MSEPTPHKRVFEYDGAYKCSDCQSQWGALPGNPVMPEVCTPRPEKLESVAALRLRVEELTHERDQAPKIELEQETDGRWLAEYKEIPGMMVYGATIGEALRKLADLIQQSEERTFGIT